MKSEREIYRMSWEEAIRTLRSIADQDCTCKENPVGEICTTCQAADAFNHIQEWARDELLTILLARGEIHQS
jgi:hypothetical protein